MISDNVLHNIQIIFKQLEEKILNWATTQQKMGYLWIISVKSITHVTIEPRFNKNVFY